MYQNKIIFLLLLICYDLVKCKGSIDGNLNCDQYANDLEIISKFPFTVNLNYQKQGPSISTAILDSNYNTVVMIQLRESGAFVPQSVFCLKNLQSLDIMNMNFVNGIVPDALSNLPLLFGLSVKNSLIIKVTDKITSLQRLESLTLDNCSLTEMPSLDGMPKLLRVTLPNNRLSKLEGLMNVRQLFLYHNLFTSIPIQTETDALTQINMNYNPVNDISMITAYTNLTELRLSNTEVTFIPESIDELQKLSFLDLSFSKIIQLPKAIFNLTRLQFLVIQGNAFSAEEINNIKSGFSTNRPTTILLI